MQSATTLFGVPFKQKPRRGQEEVFRKIHDEKPKRLNVKLPTGYGKTITAIGSYAILKNMGRCNRMLMILPTDAQREQFIQGAAHDFQSVGINSETSVVDIGYYGINAIKKHRKNESQVYAVSIQSLSNPSGLSKGIVSDLLQSGSWFVVVDEYHHYGIDKCWGRSVLDLNYEHLLAMSATPQRPGDDSAFGSPDVSVLYQNAVTENAVKPLAGHSYNYVLDLINKDTNEPCQFTTDQLAKEVGSESPEDIDNFVIERKMRWSPKYVSPLVSIPLERMMANRISTGYKLQAIVGAMSVSHAEMVCKQISELFPDLRVDWVGTGPNGRSIEDNRRVLNKFCPPKDENGNRWPEIDVLVHVGMAGEGLDSVLVSEVIFLNKASKNNSKTQEIGRAARFLPGVTGHINFDSSSDFAEYTGKSIMRAIDDMEPVDEGDGGSDGSGDGDGEGKEVPDLPDEPQVFLMDVELEKIDSGDLEEMAIVCKSVGVGGIDYESLKDGNASDWEKIESLFRQRQRMKAEQFNEISAIKQTRESVSSAVRVVAGQVVKLLTKSGARVEKTLVGDICKRINRQKKIDCGEMTEDIQVCRAHYAYVKRLQSQIKEMGVPKWLM